MAKKTYRKKSTTKQSSNEKACQWVTDKVIDMMKSQGTDWSKSWRDGTAIVPRNAKTGRVYGSFLNQLILNSVAQEQGFKSPYWNTYNGWAEMGFQVVGKSHDAKIFCTFPCYNKDPDENGKTGDQKEKPDYFRNTNLTVFNAEMVKEAVFETVTVKENGKEVTKLKTPFVSVIKDNAKTYAELNPVEEKEPETIFEKIERVEQFIKNTNAIIKHGQKGAFFNPQKDFIGMPDKELFDSPEAYYAVLLHELTHWTGHKSRLDRLKSNRWGDPLYAYEELVAEMGSAQLSHILGVSMEPREDHAIYINHWIQHLGNDKRGVIDAAKESTQAVTFLFDMQPQIIEEAA